MFFWPRIQFVAGHHQLIEDKMNVEHDAQEEDYRSVAGEDSVRFYSATPPSLRNRIERLKSILAEAERAEKMLRMPGTSSSSQSV